MYIYIYTYTYVYTYIYIYIYIHISEFRLAGLGLGLAAVERQENKQASPILIFHFFARKSLNPSQLFPSRSDLEHRTCRI